MIATAGDRRDEDMRELGDVAAQHFDVVIVREDDNLRAPRAAARPAALVAEGVRAGDGRRAPAASRSRSSSTRSRRSGTRWPAPTPATCVVFCVDKHAAVMSELENWSSLRPGRLRARTPTRPSADPDYTPVPEPAQRPSRPAADRRLETGQGVGERVGLHPGEAQREPRRGRLVAVGRPTTLPTWTPRAAGARDHRQVVGGGVDEPGAHVEPATDGTTSSRSSSRAESLEQQVPPRRGRPWRTLVRGRRDGPRPGTPPARLGS